MATSRNNYGACLDEFKRRYGEAATAYLKAYELSPEDTAILYRVFRSLYLAKDNQRLLTIALQECKKDPSSSIAS